MTTTTLTLTDFLLARIAEDEARADHTSAPYTMHWPNCDFPGDMPGVCTCDLRARVLADCRAKRAIVEELQWRPQSGMECDGHPGSWMPHGDYGRGYCMEPASRDGEEQWVLRHLAAVYADHPDYRDDWRP